MCGITYTCWRWGYRSVRWGGETDLPWAAEPYDSVGLRTRPDETSHPEQQLAPVRPHKAENRMLRIPWYFQVFRLKFLPSVQCDWREASRLWCCWCGPWVCVYGRRSAPAERSETDRTSRWTCRDRSASWPLNRTPSLIIYIHWYTRSTWEKWLFQPTLFDGGGGIEFSLLNAVHGCL